MLILVYLNIASDESKLELKLFDLTTHLLSIEGRNIGSYSRTVFIS
jgi:hypothetical protein